jgi:hypothetical protein
VRWRNARAKPKRDFAADSVIRTGPDYKINRKLRRSAHRSVTELEADIRKWINEWNKHGLSAFACFGLQNARCAESNKVE